jgi:hypothetical protein
MAATAFAVHGEALPDREAIEAEIERLIAFLDLLDPDTDLEDNGDVEPSLGCRDDLEGDTADDEPWLGAPEPSMPAPYRGDSIKAAFFAKASPHLNDGQERTAHGSQLLWAKGSADDCELAMDELANVE